MWSPPFSRNFLARTPVSEIRACVPDRSTCPDLHVIIRRGARYDLVIDTLSSQRGFRGRVLELCPVVYRIGASVAMGENEGAKVVDEECSERMVYMWGYLPGASPEKSPILSPAPVRFSDPSLAGDSWKDVCGGGCGFAMAISEKGKLITWGSADDENQSYLISGKHGEIAGHFQLPTEAVVVKAAAGWAHCASVTGALVLSHDLGVEHLACRSIVIEVAPWGYPVRQWPIKCFAKEYTASCTEEGEVYAWGWKECVPSGKVITDFITVGSLQKDVAGKQSSSIAEQGSPQSSNTSSGSDSHLDNKKVVDEVVKRRKISFSRQDSDSQASGDEFFSVSPSIVTLGNGVKITSVAVGGRHTLALSDVGQVWGWGYGGEGQLGLGSRIKMVSSPHLIPCIESASGKDKSSAFHQGSSAGAQGSNVPGSYVMEIACGGRHSVVITDAGALLTFGWGLYGQCGHGNNADQLRPTLVPSLLGTKVEKIAAGLWHTLCVSVNGHIFAFGGNQFGQLGTGSDQPEEHFKALSSTLPVTLQPSQARAMPLLVLAQSSGKRHGLKKTSPRQLDASRFENKHSRIVSCGARHSALLTDDGCLFTWGWNKYGQEIPMTETYLVKFLLVVAGQEMLPVAGGIRCCWLIKPSDSIGLLASWWSYSFDRVTDQSTFH
ncbi:hypothetical protein Fmac_011007 [Flemingia macrophylla]|uniref:Ultraviolet-B receptor UVR8 n=1 Tax=Flemingia macrophylla TaxID=520843 RepID=A0ABD1ML75_9FABA